MPPPIVESEDEDQPLVQLKKPESSVVTPIISIPKEKESSSAPASASSTKKKLSLSKIKTEESTALKSPTQSSPPKVEILVPTPTLEGKKDDDDDFPLSKLEVNKKSLKLKKEPAVKKEAVRHDKQPEKQAPIKKEKEAVVKKEKEPAMKKEKAPIIKKEKAKEANKEDNDAEDENDSDASETFIPRHIEDNTEKWQTLEHSGVFFPPAYEPHQQPLIYNGESLILPPEAEEVAGFYAAMITTDYAKSDIFNKNFFQDFRSVLQRTSPLLYKKVTDFAKCDFTVMAAYFEQQKEKKKQMTKAEKLVIKEQKLALDQIFGFAYLDGRKEKVGNYRIEPPGLFRGRGQHPKAGCLKQRVQPEQVTINIGSEAKVPEPPAGHHWKEVVHNNTVTWLATWTENVNGQPKYVFLGATSSLKGQSDFMKFEKARELKNHIDHIRTVNLEELRSEDTTTAQRATALWLIDRLALRAGNEKGEDEADTVGCCSLRIEHVQLVPPSTVVFDFLGKDSIRYYNEVEVLPRVWKNLKHFMKKGEPDQKIFDRLSTTELNKYLNSLMNGLTAKVFRTFNASFTFQQELQKTPTDAHTTVADKVLAYNRANRQVAVLCNHQRSVSKSHAESMQRINEKIMEIKYERWQVKRQLQTLLSKQELAKEPDLMKESDLETEEAVEAQRLAKLEREKKKEEKKLAKKAQDDSEKQGESSQTPTTQETNTNSKKRATPLLSSDDESAPKKQRKKDPSIDQLRRQLDTLTKRLSAARLQRIDRDENKTTALGTSKINYIDPRISVAWCVKHEVPIEKIFNKSLREKFEWAIKSVDGQWTF